MDGKRKTVLWILGGLVAMGGLTAASVPLYQYMCEVTGLGGTPKTRVAASDHLGEGAVTVRFDASVMKGMPWRFKPLQAEVPARLGENILVFYEAENLSDQPITGTATYNVTPAKAGQYFNKIECFCFTEQTLQPGERVEMPVTFWVDPELFKNPRTDEVRTITLSYTFFKAEGDKTANNGKQKREGRS